MLFYDPHVQKYRCIVCATSDLDHLHKYDKLVIYSYEARKGGIVVKRQNMCFIYLPINSDTSYICSYLETLPKGIKLSSVNLRRDYPEVFI